MSSDVRILLVTDREAILGFARKRLQTEIADEMEREMASWTARWRGEALDHYLPMGWSFGAFENGELCGFILAQPYLFFRGHTQTLWVEHVEAERPEVAKTLLDTVYRWARDKHLQCVLGEATAEMSAASEGFAQARTVERSLIELKSAKF